MNPKKIAASAVALALGTSAIVAPQATALPEEFVSPPGVLGNPSQDDCKIVMEDNVSTSQPGEARKATQNGVAAGIALNEANTEYLAWVTLDRESERIFERAEAKAEITNNATKDVTQSFTVKEQQSGALAFDAELKDKKVNLNVTDIVPVNNGSFSLKPGEKQEASAKLGLNNSLDKQTWAWKINQPTSSGQSVTRVNSWASVEVAPWPIETDNCLPITASSTKSKAIIADGNEYDTGITVANAENDFERLTGNVTVGGKAVADAKVRVDADGKVYVTLPKNATGGVDNDKPAKVDVQLLAQPREETKHSKFEAYNSPQVLRVVDNLGRVTQDSPEFTGEVPVQKFAPEYKSPATVKPGKTVNVALKTQPGDVRGKAVDATYTVTNAPEGWTAEPAKDGTLKVTAPKGAKGGDTAEFTVEVAYPDGSVDTLKPVVKVTDFQATVTTPGYGEETGKRGTEVTLTQTEKLPKGSTFTITEDQDLGEWKPQVDPNTGEITVTIPKSANPGDEKTILVDVKYPDGSTDTKVPAKVIVLNDPGYGEVTDKPGEKVELPQTGDVVDGSTFEIAPDQDLGDWKPEIDPNTGKITVTIPEGAKPGDEKEILVNVTDPNSDKPDTVPAKVIVHGTPDYPAVEKTPGDDVTLTPGKDNVPADSTFEITPDQDLGEWDPKIDPNTGEITVKVPETAKDGDKKTIDVTVTYPSGKTDTVPAGITVKDRETSPGTETPETPETPENPDKKGPTIIVIPGEPKEVTPKVSGDGDPTYKIPDGYKVPDGWNITVDPKTGDITITAPKDATPGTKIEVPVEITFPSGNKETQEIPVEVGETSEGTIPFVPGQKDPLVIFVPKDADKGSDPKLPEGWTIVERGDNSFTIEVPEGTKPGVYEIVFTGKDGSGEVKVLVEVKQAVTEQGSSENLQKCFANMSSESNPLLWLVPVGLLIAIGAPLAGPLGQELGKAAANVSAQMNIPNPLEQFGIGGNTNRRPQPEWMTQLQAEAGRIQAQFGPQVTQAAAIGLSLAGLAAGLGVLAALCKDGELPEWAASSTNAEGSSSNKDAEGSSKEEKPAEEK
ncbi:YPDG domain-containing protein [Corynebacterium sp. MSK008]|uniref:YPDG domain-containing protein n=1 Tax=Corynebacterium sp. MSK008 TaxID=3050188 RepID=UPI00254D7E81|nr:YPDG domain-containing protein [Corynebacterium sp. MSK008]MDK8880446.1 YPDG domain-containing protein [Corynebacterium sp. MSK008]